MTKLNPNKETIRRICYIFKCEECWLLSDVNQPSLLVQLDTEKVDDFKQELESWSGCTFSVYNSDSPKANQEVIKLTGEQLLPISKDKPLADIERRRKHMHKKAD